MRVCEFVREHGEQETFGGGEYTYLDLSDRKLWTMMAVLESTIILNAKFHSFEDQALLAEEQTGRNRKDLGLRDPGHSPGGAEARRPRARPLRAEPELFDYGNPGRVKA